MAAWIFGGIYYTALSKPWMAAQGRTLEQFKAEQDAKSILAKGAPFVVVFISEIIIGWTLYGILLHMTCSACAPALSRPPCAGSALC